MTKKQRLKFLREVDEAVSKVADKYFQNHNGKVLIVAATDYDNKDSEGYAENFMMAFGRNDNIASLICTMMENEEMEEMFMHSLLMYYSKRGKTPNMNFNVN